MYIGGDKLLPLERYACPFHLPHSTARFPHRPCSEENLTHPPPDSSQNLNHHPAHPNLNEQAVPHAAVPYAAVVEEASAIEAVIADAGSVVDEARRGGEEGLVIEVAGEDSQEAAQGEDLAIEVASGEGLVGVVGLGVEGRRTVCGFPRRFAGAAWMVGAKVFIRMSDSSAWLDCERQDP